MKTQDIKNRVQSHEIKKASWKNLILAFISGGILGALAQGLLNVLMNQMNMLQSQAAAPLAMIFIAVASICTGLGFYDTLGQICGAGLFIPITGFANSLASSALEHKSEGLIYGIGCNMFKLAGSVLCYGVVAAYTLGILRYFLGF